MKLKPFKLFKSLLQKSARVQLEIDAETSKKYPDWMRVIMLKKQRLLIKDKLQRLRQKVRGHGGERRARRRLRLAGQH
ncbi:MAG: DUF465 domain-containing protein [Rickettsiales bacterium]|nr:DUF465 domain-containing protein [Rickettsiales bacterium]